MTIVRSQLNNSHGPTIAMALTCISIVTVVRLLCVNIATAAHMEER